MRKFLLLTVTALTAANATGVYFDGKELAPGQYYNAKPVDQDNLKQQQDRFAERRERQSILNSYEKSVDLYGGEEFVTVVFTSEKDKANLNYLKEYREGSVNSVLEGFKKEFLEAGNAFGLTQDMINTVEKEALEAWFNLPVGKQNFSSLRALVGRSLGSQVTNKRALGNFWRKHNGKITTLIAFGKIANTKFFGGKDAKKFYELVTLVLTSKGRACVEAHGKLVAFFTEKKALIVQNLKNDILKLKTELRSQKENLAVLEKEYTDFLKENSPAEIAADKELAAENKKYQEDIKKAQGNVSYLNNAVKEKEDTVRAFEAMTPEFVKTLFSKPALSSGVNGMAFTPSEEKEFNARVLPYKNSVEAIEHEKQVSKDQKLEADTLAAMIHESLESQGSSESEIQKFKKDEDVAHWMGVYNGFTIDSKDAYDLLGEQVKDFEQAVALGKALSPFTFKEFGFNNKEDRREIQKLVTERRKEIMKLKTRDGKESGDKITAKERRLINILVPESPTLETLSNRIEWIREHPEAEEEAKNNTIYTLVKANPGIFKELDEEYKRQNPPAVNEVN